MAGKRIDPKSKRKAILLLSKQQMEMFNFVVNSLTDPVFIYNLQGQLVKANLPAIKVLGFNPENYTQKELIEKLNGSTAGGKKITSSSLPSALALKGKVVRNKKIIFNDAKHKERAVFVSASPIRSRGKVVSSLVVWHDVTEQVAAENAMKNTNRRIKIEVQKQTAELIQSNQVLLDETRKRVAAQEELRLKEKEMSDSKRLLEIGRLSAIIAHELRNPLAAIRAAAYNIKIKVNSPKIESNLANIEIKIAESEQIINNLLSYSRVKIPRFEKVNVAELLSQCLDSALERLNKRKITLSRNISGIKDEEIWADPLQLKEVFQNILENAFDACAEKEGLIIVTGWKTETENIAISFRDNGVGMSETMIKRIFEPFFTTKSKGTGLGLAICRQIIDLHCGEISAESTPGVGATFKVTLPIRKCGSQ